MVGRKWFIWGWNNFLCRWHFIHPYRKLQLVFSRLYSRIQLTLHQLPNEYWWSCYFVGHQRQPAERPLLRKQQRYDLRNANRIVDTNVLHGLGEQQRWLKRGLPQHHHCGRTADPLIFAEHAGVDDQQPEQRLATECDLDRFGYHHIVGNQRDPAYRPQLWNEQRNDLGHSDGFADDGRDLHDLGQQHGRFVLGHHHHHHQR